MHPLPLAGEGWGEGASRSQELQRALGISYLFITHDIGVVEYIADDIVVMQKGRLEESGPAARVLGEPQSAYTRTLLAAVPRVAVVALA